MKFDSPGSEPYAEKDLQPSAAVRRYLQRKRAKGKSLLARVLDAVMLLAVLFAAVFVYLCGKGVHVRHALLLSGVVGTFFAVLYKLYAAWALQRYMPREIKRISKELLRENMPFVDRQLYRDLCCKASGVQNPVVFFTAEPVGADMLLPYLLELEEEDAAFCSFSGFTDAAKKLVTGRFLKVRLIGADPLLDAAMEEPCLRPSLREVYRHIETEEAACRQRRKRARSLPGEDGGKRYLLAAGLLVLFSFQTGYALYYRMLAGLCLSVAAMRSVLRRGTHTEYTI